MANLLDTIRQNRNNLMAQPGVEDQALRTAQLLRAKSGKAVAAPGVAMSNLGEQQAAVQAGQEAQQVNQGAEIAAQGQQVQQQALQQGQQQAEAEFNQQRQANNLQNTIKTESLLRDLERDKGRIDVQRDAARLDQVAQGLRLQNRQYTDQLQMEGARARLDDSMQFSQAMQKSVLGANQDLIQERLGMQSILDDNDRAFSKKMAQMDVDTAWSMFKNDMKAQKEQAMWSGIAGLGGAAVGGASAYQNSPSSSSGGSAGSSAEGPAAGSSVEAMA